LRNGNIVTIPEEIDFGRRIGHTFFGDCWASKAEWYLNKQIRTQEVVSPTPSNDGLIPVDYNDINIWRHSYPITNITVVNLNSGEIFFTNNYFMQKDITIDLSDIQTGTFFSVIIQSFDGRKFSKKFVMP
jgi:hypothetical protein